MRKLIFATAGVALKAGAQWLDAKGYPNIASGVKIVAGLIQFFA